MPRTQSKRTERLEARISPEMLAAVRRAAEMQGRSVSEFVVNAAGQAALRAIEDMQVFRLSADDQIRFVEALADTGAQPADAMKRAAKAHEKLFVQS